MKGDPNVIRLLNAQLTNELTAVNQPIADSVLLQAPGEALDVKKLVKPAK